MSSSHLLLLSEFRLSRRYEELKLHDIQQQQKQHYRKNYLKQLKKSNDVNFLYDEYLFLLNRQIAEAKAANISYAVEAENLMWAIRDVKAKQVHKTDEVALIELMINTIELLKAPVKQDEKSVGSAITKHSNLIVHWSGNIRNEVVKNAVLGACKLLVLAAALVVTALAIKFTAGAVAPVMIGLGALFSVLFGVKATVSGIFSITRFRDARNLHQVAALSGALVKAAREDQDREAKSADVSLTQMRPS